MIGIYGAGEEANNGEFRPRNIALQLKFASRHGWLNLNVLWQIAGTQAEKIKRTGFQYIPASIPSGSSLECSRDSIELR